MPASSPREKLKAARAIEAERLTGLCTAAHYYVRMDNPTKYAEALKAAAKAWTNAHHQASRCAKHLREGS